MYGEALGAVISAGEGLLKHRAGKKANREFAARRQAAQNRIIEGAGLAKAGIRREVDRLKATTRQDLAKRGMDSTSMYDAVINDALDRQFRAEADIEQKKADDLAQILLSSPDPYDGNAVLAALEGVSRAVGAGVGGSEGSGNTELSGASRGGLTTNNNDNPSLYSAAGGMVSAVGGGPIVAPGGGTNITPDQFGASPGRFPGQAGYSPYASLLADDNQELEADGLPKPPRRRKPAASFYSM